MKSRVDDNCGRDFGLVDGEGPPWTGSSFVPGHEVCAKVVELGEVVNSLSIGDRVPLHGLICCGTCTPCRKRRDHQCDDFRGSGFTVIGGYFEYASFHSHALTPFPTDLSDLNA